jgi:[ribosomal protein S5]-alanine N-acetyltransferase
MTEARGPEVAQLVGERVLLRGIREDDIEGRMRCGQDPEIVRMFGGTLDSPRPVTLHEGRRWFDEIAGDENPHHWVIVHDGRFIGTARLHSLDPSARTARYAIGILDSDQLGGGLGTETTRLVLAYAFERLQLRQVDLRVLEFNRRAIACYQKCGFVLHGRESHAVELEGQWHDDLIMVATAPEPND